MSRKMQGNLMLLLTAIIWGFGFVAQSSGMQYVRPFTFNAARNIVGCLALIPVTIIFRKIQYRKEPLALPERRRLNRTSVIGGIFCGLALSAASLFQQYGVSMTNAGKAGFITALYIILVPLLGIFIGKKFPKIIWLCVGIALAGFYLLCIRGDFSIALGDILCLICAFLFAVQILLIDHFTEKNVDCFMMSCVEFGVTAIISGILMLIFDAPSLSAIWDARVTILYAGLFSTGVAYTLQVIAQKRTDPTVASLLMSLESVFSVIGGWLILHEHLSLRELLGCLLVFAAVILSQIPLPSKKN